MEAKALKAGSLENLVQIYIGPVWSVQYQFTLTYLDDQSKVESFWRVLNKLVEFRMRHLSLTTACSHSKPQLVELQE